MHARQWFLAPFRVFMARTRPSFAELRGEEEAGVLTGRAGEDIACKCQVRAVTRGLLWPRPAMRQSPSSVRASPRRGTPLDQLKLPRPQIQQRPDWKKVFVTFKPPPAEAQAPNQP